MARLIRGHWLMCTVVLAGCSPRAGDPGRPDTRPRSPATAIEIPEAPAEWRIVPGRSAGPVTADISEADLRKRYGEAVLESTRIQIGEGETMAGAVLFGGDSLRRAEIIWGDTLNRRRPSRLILRGSRSQWRTDEGISLGTTLHELERLNGRPFTLAGFGWDYGGVITDWAGGNLGRVLTGTLLYLDPGPGAYESAEYSQVLGDRDYSSASAPMQRLDPKVVQIFMDFE
jgi:hypothetical protein